MEFEKHTLQLLLIHKFRALLWFNCFNYHIVLKNTNIRMSVQADRLLSVLKIGSQ